MKKTFIKGLVAVATMALTMSFSSLLVSAEELDMTTAAGATSGIFTVGTGVATNSAKSYTLEGETTERKNTALKFSSNIGDDGANSIKFTTEGAAKVTVVTLGGGSGERGLNIYKEVNGVPELLQEKFVVTPDNSTMVQGGYDITEAGTYYIARLAGKTMNIYYLDVTATTGTVYDKKSFHDETTDNTATIPGDVASEAVVTADVIAEVTNGAAFTDKTTLGADKAYGNITFGSGLLMYNDNTLRTGGSTGSSNGRYVKVNAKAGDVIVLEGCRSQNSADTTRYAFLSASAGGSEIVRASAPLEAGKVSLPVETAGDYYVCFSNGIMFNGVSVYGGVEIIIPTVTLTQTTVADATKLAFKGVISGNASDAAPVTAINVVTSRGYDASATAIPAKKHSITTVAQEGSDYAFIVTIDKATVDALPGLKIQATVDYEKNGATVTSYSKAIEYPTTQAQ